MRLVDRVIARKGTRLYETGHRAQLDLCPLVCNHSVRGSHLTFEIPLLLAIPLAAPVVSPFHPILLLTQLPDSPDGSTVAERFHAFCTTKMATKHRTIDYNIEQYVVVQQQSSGGVHTQFM